MAAPTLKTTEFVSLLREICVKTTSADPDGWTPENPLWGHCAVVAILAQQHFGGEILRADITHVPEFAHMRSHYWNRLPDGAAYDFTAPQFGERYPAPLTPALRERKELLKHEGTRTRYEELAFRFALATLGKNPIREDGLYRDCLFQAVRSPCEKMKFGALLIHGYAIVARTHNAAIPGLEHFCAKRCVRLDTTSRTESMIGSCGHAEEWAIWQAVGERIDLKECHMYVVGIYGNGVPWIKERPDFTCLRCANQLAFANLRFIVMPVKDHWETATPAKALERASLYATEQLKV